MERSITGFHQDEVSDWVAELDCGHGQHVRHKPPFFNRPWVVSRAGRDDKLGVKLNCVRCDRLELPASVEWYKSTPEFDEHTLPAEFLKRHTLKSGSWARITVTSGEMSYRIDAPLDQCFFLTPNNPGIVPPAVPHHLEPIGPVRLYIEFYSLP